MLFQYRSLTLNRILLKPKIEIEYFGVEKVSMKLVTICSWWRFLWTCLVSVCKLCQWSPGEEENKIILQNNLTIFKYHLSYEHLLWKRIFINRIEEILYTRIRAINYKNDIWNANSQYLSILLGCFFKQIDIVHVFIKYLFFHSGDLLTKIDRTKS